jgi:IMP dehydrogenase
MVEGSSDSLFSGRCAQTGPGRIEGRVPYKRICVETIFQLVGGLRQGMGYCGVLTIDEMKTKTKFIRITNAGLTESHPHDVFITKELPITVCYKHV